METRSSLLTRSSRLYFSGEASAWPPARRFSSGTPRETTGDPSIWERTYEVISRTEFIWAEVKEKANVIVADMTAINLTKQKEEPVAHTSCGAAKVPA